MALPLAEAASQKAEHDSPACTTKEFATGLLGHDKLFKDNSTYPESCICEKFGEERALVISYLEREILGVRAELREILGALEACDERTNKEYVSLKENEATTKLSALEDLLHRHWRVVRDARWMAQSPQPSMFFMNHYRALLRCPRATRRAPNGQDRSRYGSKDDSVPPSVTAIDSENLGQLERILAYKVGRQVSDYVWNPLKRVWIGLNTGEWDYSLPPDIDGRTVSLFAKTIACMLALSCLAVAIATLIIIGPQGDRMVVMPCFGIVFIALVLFLGPESLPMCQLIVSYYQTMVFSLRD
ncbi:hypothetical protein CC78DRAFT_548601 [Lojkania enalia]|uniref:DUF6594 domain-containing protein n=1 Tax=Lojkania enalia TaxID=147567 RepID=A0A9P4N1V1_9PLEO|nr:hypothetical protein CC78DRAFT_548601 [Didymosphaeria enalia]